VGRGGVPDIGFYVIVIAIYPTRETVTTHHQQESEPALLEICPREYARATGPIAYSENFVVTK
jgi:hypothetical protein